MDAPASEPPSPLPAHEHVNTGGDNVAVSTQRGSAARHLAILSTGLAAIAFIPYLLTRRQVSSLRRRIDEMGATTALLKQRQGLAQVAPGVEGGATASGLLTQMRQEMAAMREQLEQKDSERAKALSDMTMDVIHVNEELDHLRGDITSAVNALQQGFRKDTEDNRGEAQEQIRQLRVEQEALRSELFKLSDEIQSAKTGPQASELQRLLLETKQTRAVFGAIGSSLGDIAHIIQRVEIEMGHERTGGYDPVERLRILALQMQDESFQVGERQKPYEGGRRGRG